MAKKDKEEVEVLDVPVAVEVVPVTPVVKVSPPRDKVYSIEQWAQLRGKQPRHLGGIRAFLKLEAGNKYTLAAWDAKMAAY